jgi:hypothetical protein
MKAVLALVVACVLGAFAFGVWPTLYRYDRLKVGNSEVPVRIHRFTGDTHVLGAYGWQRRGAPQPAPTPGQPAQATAIPTPSPGGYFGDIVKE